MKCFYCDAQFDGTDNICSACKKKLEKKCKKCDVLYEASANFCMSCGGKLDSFSVESDLMVIDEIQEVDDKKEPTEAPPPDAEAAKFVVTDGELLDMEDLELEAIHEDDHHEEIEIELHDGDSIGNENEEITLEIEEETEEVVPRNLIPDEEQEPIVDLNEPIDEEAVSQSDQDADNIAVSIEKIEQNDDKNDLETDELETIDLSLKTREIHFTDEKKTLNFVPTQQKYDISLQPLKTYLETEVGDSCCLSLCDDVEQKLKNGKGGFYFVTGKEGVGKNFFANRVKRFVSEQPIKSLNIIVTTSNAFDFDYMIFVHLIRSIMKIKTNDMNLAVKKFDKYFADALPKSKKEAVAALVCLNFVPLQVKLPKNDLEYLISYVLYALSKSKPILWVVNNASQLNTRSINFFKQLSAVCKWLPISVVFIADEDAKIMEVAGKDQVYLFSGMDHAVVLKNINNYLHTPKLPVDVEKILKKVNGNMLYAYALIELMKDEKKIFEMRGNWRFSKLPDNYIFPESVVEIIKNRYHNLEKDVQAILKKVVLLNLYEIPKTLLFILFGENYADLLLPLIRKGYMEEEKEIYKFTSRSLLNNIREEVEIDDFGRAFYQEMVHKLSVANVEIPGLNRHWLLLSFINLGRIVDKRYNSFLFSSAVYMEKLGFFEIAQRSYQTILSSFDDDSFDDFKLLLEAKNARLWRFMELQWAKIFWRKLRDVAVKRNMVHLELVSKGELLLLETNKLIVQDMVDVIKDLHQAGSYEHEISFIDRTTEMLFDSENLFDANTFALRGYKIVKDIISRDTQDYVGSAGFVYALFIRSACKLAEVNIALKHYDYASQILNEALEYAERFNISYFKAKIKMLLGKIKYISSEQNWEDFVKEGFYQSISGMDFQIIRKFLEFFEEEELEKREWLLPFIEYKNWINF